MSNITQAAESIRRLAVQFQDMQFAADTLESIGSIMQQKDETAKALMVSLADVATAKGEAQAIRDAAEKLKAEAEAKVRNSTDEVAKLIKAANDRAGQIVSDANAKADLLGRELSAVVQKQLTAATINLAATKDSLAIAKSDLQGAISEYEATTNALDALNSKIASAKAAISKMLGAQ